MTYDQALKLITEHEIVAVKIDDYKGKLILRFDEDTPAQLIHKLTMYQDSLTGYGKILIQAADAASLKKLWRDSFTWEVEFYSMGNNRLPGLPGMQTMPLPSVPMAGIISAAEADLKTQLSELKQQVEFDKRMNEMEAKFSKKTSSTDFDLIKLVPLLGLFLKIPEDKLAQMTTLGSVFSNMNNQPLQPAMKGMGSLKENPKLKIATAGEEDALWDEIEEQIVSLSGKIDLTSIRDFIKTLNDDPAMLQKLQVLITTFK